ncbi:MAG: Gfo/Idh/MocA family oxidoreductase [Oscillospiraceae bacterium]|nr:Gfo/Idh/MocA family oxidoreductase [Oscillospiraceae bacterium]
MIKVAIIGTGNICPSHIKAYKTFPERCRIAALVDIYPEKAQARVDEFGLDAKVYSDYKEMLEVEKPDLVSICLPPYLHASVAIDAMEAGANVVCEKPMASSLAECDRMIEAEKRTGKMLCCIAQNRYRDDHMGLKKILDSGLLGRIVHANVESIWWRGHSYYDLWWRGTWEKEGGGCTLNHAVHHIDLLLWMMGMPKRVTAVLSNASHDNSEVEDVSVAILEYPGGAIAQLTSSVIAHGQFQTMVFQGEKAMAAVPWRRYASTSLPNGFPIENEELEKEIDKLHESFEPLAYTLHTAEIENALSALESPCQPFIRSADGRATVELITAIYESGFTGHAVELPLKPDDPFYTVEGMLKNVRHFHEKGASVENFTDEGMQNSFAK